MRSARALAAVVLVLCAACALFVAYVRSRRAVGEASRGVAAISSAQPAPLPAPPPRPRLDVAEVVDDLLSPVRRAA